MTSKTTYLTILPYYPTLLPTYHCAAQTSGERHPIVRRFARCQGSPGKACAGRAAHGQIFEDILVRTTAQPVVGNGRIHLMAFAG
jgi:hypothetical protein